ncbi:MAG: T9SS type A sorting domain-containing protein, partial [Bacteroidales bacterium]|nr:T9SS type A sorting domain-containing protein [Bacteroidales bacterium]
ITAKSETFSFSFSGVDNISFGSEGIYNISAWAEVENNFHSDTIKAQINVTESVRNENISVASKVTVYPNPSNGKFKVDANGRTTMEIVGFDGVVLGREVITGTSEFSLNAKGLYLLRFIDENGKKTTQKLIVR